ncbi:YqxA family protein [Priestia koreensis]|uniref:DUF3679 domain-containing protein n=1 Tax=Priestia koreensis TaxID=284581 RepID=A0A0M0KYG2_9BACI|nr:YqxA family protein [Priestia koreensis]KOO43861.1 hypothetical protein AMD01_14050 [Priestia koreensis]MCM3002548.1 YqxA family protein [Priestia koreensis]UNL84258.1 YqxA family protein [Priestia koreensis]
MVKFTIRCLLVASLLFFGVLLGMQTANEGLIKMKGYEDPALSKAVNISTDDGEVEASVLGAKSKFNLEEKQQLLEKRKAFNLFSNAGKKIANATKGAAEKGMHLLDGIFK